MVEFREIKGFEGLYEAGRSIEKYHSAIANTCKGFQSKAYGFEWRYKNAGYYLE